MTTYLVTGAAGFIGSHLCDRLLAEGKRVVGLDDLSKGRIANLVESRSYGGQFTFYTMDVRAEGLRTILERHQPEVVMHLAAQSSVRSSLEDPILDAGVNVMGLLNLMEGAARAGVRKVVFASSGGTIYGDQRRIPIKETARKGSRPTSPYGVAKKVAEDYLAFFARYRRVDYTVLALANVYGPRQNPEGEAGVVAIFAGRMLRGESPAIFGDGNQTRDYVFVDDAVHAFSLSADAGSGQLMNVGTGLETGVNMVYRLLARITGFAGPPGRGPLPPGEVLRNALDNALAAAELGWKPWTHLEDGLGETVAYLREAFERT
jgi:UDP-glucose 4-epimerase